MFNVHMGIPEMKDFWEKLKNKIKINTANKNEEMLYKKLGKAFNLISQNPKYPGLRTHEIKELSDKTGEKVWESYLENNTPKAGRVFWGYGPDKNDITIIGWAQHPNDKSAAYDKITLSLHDKEEN